MSTTRVMPGIENLEGQTFNGLTVERLVSRHPVRWCLRCSRCGTHWDESHERVRYVTCRNSSCGKTSAPRSSLITTGVAVPAVRSRDSDAAREFRREPPKPQVRWAPLTAEMLRNADPDGLRHHLDYLERK
jgi:hypothetical protein